ncbi:NADH:ubiquinone reductase (Na(+)-transporting) subunit D [Ruegeria pomeroyi]|nr:NADH:ubiquinone reductase (Na(+)-transporting) subunit D [Ruegeria pomeroyi]MCE8534625.1 NADH:ubiquinone reductase (Na(+)-transporting) subunit D [Ruegeria pomeroyi]
MKIRSTLLNPIFENNPVLLQVLGVCSALAITNSLYTSLIMGVSLTAVATFSNAVISALRHTIPSSLRIIIQMTVIATGVVVVDQVLQAFAPDAARTLSVFIGLIVTNCIVLGRAEAFAAKNTVGMSILDGIGNGLGYTAVLVAVGTVRELFGAGTLLGATVFTLASDGGSYVPNQLMLLPPSAFFIIGFLIWGLRMWKREQIEAPEFNEVKVRGDLSFEETGERVL